MNKYNYAIGLMYEMVNACWELREDFLKFIARQDGTVPMTKLMNMTSS